MQWLKNEEVDVEQVNGILRPIINEQRMEIKNGEADVSEGKTAGDGAMMD